jgi:DNA-directed RNA polymerase subunit RPC12/RpoP
MKKMNLVSVELVMEKGMVMEKEEEVKEEKKVKKTKKYECPICEEFVTSEKNVHIRCGDCNFRMVLV